VSINANITFVRFMFPSVPMKIGADSMITDQFRNRTALG